MRFTISTKRELKEHYKVDHRDTRFKCDRCNYDEKPAQCKCTECDLPSQQEENWRSIAKWTIEVQDSSVMDVVVKVYKGQVWDGTWERNVELSQLKVNVLNAICHLNKRRVEKALHGGSWRSKIRV